MTCRQSPSCLIVTKHAVLCWHKTRNHMTTLAPYAGFISSDFASCSAINLLSAKVMHCAVLERELVRPTCPPEVLPLSADDDAQERFSSATWVHNDCHYGPCQHRALGPAAFKDPSGRGRQFEKGCSSLCCTRADCVQSKKKVHLQPEGVNHANKGVQLL